MKRLSMYAILGAAALFPAHATFAQGSPTYGSQLMTPQERSEYRAKMRAAKTAEEREAISAEHHERMKERAQAREVTLPDERSAESGRGAAAGGTMGPGGGMGRGGGMGPGGGMGGGGRGR